MPRRAHSILALLCRMTLGAAPVLLIGCASPTPPTPIEPGSSESTDAIELRFNWPERVALSVTRSYERTDRLPKGETTVRSRGHSSLHGARLPDDYRVQFGPFEYDEREPLPESQQDPIAWVNWVSRYFQPYQPGLSVDSRGRVIEILGVDSLRAEVRSGYQTIPGLLQNPQARPVIDSVTSSEYFERRAIHFWSELVGVWAGGAMTVGQTIRGRGLESGGLRPEAPHLLAYSLVDRVPCSIDDSVRSCARLEISQETDTSNFEVVVASLLGEAFLANIPTSATRWVTLERRIVLDTHPETLIPLRLLEERRFDIYWRDAKMTTHSIGQTEFTTLDFARESKDESPTIGEI